MTPDLIILTQIAKQYQMGAVQIPVLQGIDLTIHQNDFIAIMGPSGSGKSTLLHIIGCLDRPTSGTYLLQGKSMSDVSDKESSRIRATHIGFVFQKFNLIPTLNVMENVELPFLYADIDVQIAQKQAAEAIKRVGLEDRIYHKPSELSGGEMQRAAIARAVAIRPKIILADEPTGNLDSKTGRAILRLFEEFHSQGAAIIMVTHDKEVASFAKTIIYLKDGKIEDKIS
ncbi:MAG: macrolide ABC transporter ATP-binding protein [Desulfobacteraceae bacterium IS3]|nr:MAG: macrolide ABC transporter ATP-binding protein [Desulfobacteraceae bacterium IS3]HAO22300.1 macrolide ABC transporter ATP-binding protein [Desulfobacteraceae bacterium]